MSLERINFHHLHYFWAVANDGNLTRTAKHLRVSQSALSAQIRQLEEQLGAPLFLREGRRLVLSEAGRLAKGHQFSVTKWIAVLLTSIAAPADATSIFV